MVFPSLSIACWLGVLAVVSFATAVCAETRSAAPDKEPSPGKLWAYIGTNTTGGASKGIYRFDFDPVTGKLSSRALVAETVNPTFLAIRPGQRFLYSVNEINGPGGKKSGGITGYKIDPKSGDLTQVNQQPTGGAGPCHLAVDKEGQHVLAANYGGGSFCVLPIADNGRLGDATAFIQDSGPVADPKRQGGPHAHCIVLDAANRFAFGADLGLDKVMSFRYDLAKGTLAANDPPALVVAPRAGPRHFAFHPSGRYAYVINEIDSTVDALSYDAAHGMLKILQTVSTLPKDFKGDNTTAEVDVHPSGKFLYGSNRGHDSIVVFAINPSTGELTYGSHQAKHIKEPRNFAIDPTGTFVIVGNQKADTLAVFRIDQQSGALTLVGDEVAAPRPVCIVMIPAGK